MPRELLLDQMAYLYQSEQQDKSDDEVNIIEEGRNYGWPKLSGFCDGNYNGLTLANKPVISEETQCATLNSKDPVYTLFTDMNPGTLGTNYLTWPTVAASSIDVYEKNVIPNWNRSLLVTSLKAGRCLGFISMLQEQAFWIVQQFPQCEGKEDIEIFAFHPMD